MGIRVTEAHRSKTPSELSKNETWLRADDPTLLIDNGRFVEGTVNGSDAGGVGCRGTPALPTRCFDWSGTTITVKFTGSTFLRVSLAGSSEWDVIHTSTDQAERIITQTRTVFSSHPGGKPDDDKLRSTFTILRTAERHLNHTVQLVKRNEMLCGVISFSGVYLEAGARTFAPPRRHRRLIFLGDSITCGYGMLSNDTTQCNGWTCGSLPGTLPNEEVAYDSSGSRVGRMFEAGTQLVCVSGDGYDHPDYNTGPYNTGNGSLEHAFFKKLGGETLVAANRIDPVAWAPAGIVINVGQNDFPIPHANASSLWEVTYLHFLRQLRVLWPSAHFFLGCFPMDGMLVETQAIRLVAAKFQDPRTTVLDFEK